MDNEYWSYTFFAGQWRVYETGSKVNHFSFSEEAPAQELTNTLNRLKPRIQERITERLLEHNIIERDKELETCHLALARIIEGAVVSSSS